MAIKAFDRYFYNLPEIKREPDFHKYWEKSLSDIRKVPLEPEIHENSKKTTSKFKAFDISYNGFLKTRIRGILYVPRKKEKFRVIIHIHDYNRYPEKGLVRYLNENTAHLILILRGHEIIEKRTEEEENQSLGFIVENIIDLDTYYARSVYLDIFRSIDFLRLNSSLDCNKIGIYGKGFGAAAAFFTAVYSGRIGAIVLDCPLFCDLPLSQNISQSDTAKEINDIINIQRAKKNQIKRNLSYLDIINFSHELNIPALFITGLKDTIAPAECVLGLFNHVQSEKTIEIYPDDENEAGGETQKIKSLNWIAAEILKN
ncbi:MAG TPA: acetylxylan esterase [Spirochaetota bacterium]|nr:acetylxylan esterase [Spirochaetota bacterium]HPJ33650.1 acetylxylan esterase [Spirochaetota bacterium]